MSEDIETNQMHEMPIAKELEKVALNNKWVQLQFLVEKRSNTLRSHISRVDSDISKAAKIQHDVKHIDGEISNLADRLDLEKRRSIASVSSSVSNSSRGVSNFANENQRRNLEELDHKIWTCTNTVKQLLSDCEQLVDSKFVHAEQLKRRVLVLLQRANELSRELEQVTSQIPERNIFAQLNSSLGEGSGYDSKQQYESILAQIQTCTKWVEAHSTQLSLAELGGDLESIKAALQMHTGFAKEVKTYRINVEQCLVLSKSFSFHFSDHAEITRAVQTLEQKYAKLVVRNVLQTCKMWVYKKLSICSIAQRRSMNEYRIVHLRGRVTLKSFQSFYKVQFY